MSLMGLYALTPKAKYKFYKGDQNVVVKNHLLTKVIDEENNKTYYERNFMTTKCNEIWTPDISEFHIVTGKLYLSPILECIIAKLSLMKYLRPPNFKQITDMLNKAFNVHKDLNNLIFHSDQGWQYQMTNYHERLKDKGIIQSMSRKGNYLDNAPMENFFSKMKNEMFYGFEYTFETLDELRQAMEDYIEYITIKELLPN